MSPSPFDIQGQHFGNYEILEKLGAGGMGTVYKARDMALDRFVAIKVLAPALQSDPICVERFRQEAKSIAAIRHPNLMHVYTVASHEGTHYFAMEFIAGQSLSEILRSHGPLSVEEASGWILEILDALTKVHDAGIVHRDLKPGNVMVDEDGHAVVLDFGLSKDTSAVMGLTSADTIMGTPDYMAPEQIEGEMVTPATDLYALGVMAYEMLTNVLPFHRKSAIMIMRAHCEEPPRSILAYRGDLPEALAAMIHKAIARDPQNRFSSAQAFSAALRGMCGEGDGPAPETIMAPASVLNEGDCTRTTVAAPRKKAAHKDRPRKRKKKEATLDRKLKTALLALAILLCLLLLRVIRGRPQLPDPVPEPQVAALPNEVYEDGASRENPKVRIFLKDGTTVVGELQVSSADGVKLKRSSDGVVTSLGADEIQSILYESWAGKVRSNWQRRPGRVGDETGRGPDGRKRRSATQK